MDVLTSIKGQSGLPRYFAPAFQVAQGMGRGRLDFVLPDGRRFRVDGALPGPVGEVVVHNPDTFAPALISAVLAEPKLSVEQATQIWKSPTWNRGELRDLFIKLFAALFLMTGIGTWWLVLTATSRRSGAAESSPGGEGANG